MNWKLYRTLLISAVLSVVALLPYLLTIQAAQLKEVGLPLSTIILASIGQSAIFLALILYLGLRLSKSVGLSIPYLEKYLAGKQLPEEFKPLIKKSILYGIALAITLLLIDLVFTQFGIRLTENLQVPAWKGFLASFYGGITEEIILRLFFMSLLVWVLAKVARIKAPIKSNGIMWAAIFIAAILFGIGHLPATAALAPLTPLIIIRALLLNGVAGTIFGYLFWKKGLESAMIAHFTTDIMLHVVFSALF